MPSPLLTSSALPPFYGAFLADTSLDSCPQLHFVVSCHSLFCSPEQCCKSFVRGPFLAIFCSKVELLQSKSSSSNSFSLLPSHKLGLAQSERSSCLYSSVHLGWSYLHSSAFCSYLPFPLISVLIESILRSFLRAAWLFYPNLFTGVYIALPLGTGSTDCAHKSCTATLGNKVVRGDPDA